MIFSGGNKVLCFLSLTPLETAGLTLKITYYPCIGDVAIKSKGSFPALEVYTSKKNKTLPALHGLVFV